MFWNILARSSSGPGRRPFTAETRVRFPYGSQLKTKIKDMANHKSALKRIRQTAKRRVIKDFDQDILSKNLLKFINSIIV